MRTMPGGIRNGLPETRGYVYRGKGYDTLTAHWDDLPPAKPRKRSRPVRVHYDTGGVSRCGWCTSRSPVRLTVDRARVTCERCITFLGIGVTP